MDAFFANLSSLLIYAVTNIRDISIHFVHCTCILNSVYDKFNEIMINYNSTFAVVRMNSGITDYIVKLNIKVCPHTKSESAVSISTFSTDNMTHVSICTSKHSSYCVKLAKLRP